uniref:Receptor ligand binding region domain-containing protein n=1 Tax=Glossina palpalis gambiensis TaxID=67801 RepID=A0A1B0BPM6_9MUSC
MTCDGILTFWIYFFLILSVLLNEFRLIKAGRPNELHIGGIFPIAGKGGWQGGQACMPAARLALDDVNKETNLLPGFRLILHSNDSEVN